MSRNDDNRNRAYLSLATGTLRKVDDAKNGQTVDVDLMADERRDEVQRLQQYGMTSFPLEGAEVTILAPGGNRSSTIVVNVGDRRYRLKGGQAGEVAIHDDQGQKVHLTRDGVVIETAKAVTITGGEKIDLAAPEIVLTGNVRLGSAAAARKVSGIGDVDVAGHDLVSGAPTVFI